MIKITRRAAIISICILVIIIGYQYINFFDDKTKEAGWFKGIGFFSSLISIVLLIAGFSPTTVKWIKGIIGIKESMSVKPNNAIKILQDLNQFFRTVKRENHKLIEESIEIKNLGLGADSEFIKTKYRLFESIFLFNENSVKSESEHKIDFEEKIEGSTYCILVGDVGSGKSLNLLKMVESKTAFDKITDPDYIIPIYINISSWKSSFGKDFKDWLINYICNESVYKSKLFWLINERQVTVILDGFDELAKEERESCFFSILEYGESFILSSRKEEFLIFFRNLDDDKKEILKEAEKDVGFKVYEINPLENDAIEGIIKQSKKEESAEIIEFIKKTPIYNNDNAGLSNGLRTSLIINLFILTYSSFSEKEKEDLKNAKENDLFLNLLWKKYENIAITKKYFPNEGDDQNQAKKDKVNKIKTRIQWLSRLMKENNQFFIEQIQPALFLQEGIDKAAGRQLYYFISRFISCLLLSVSVGLIIARPFSFLGNASCCSLILVAITLWYNKKKKDNSSLLVYALRLTLIIILFTTVSGIYQGFCAPRLNESAGFSRSEAIPGVIFGLFFGLIFGIRILKQSDSDDILPIQKIIVNNKIALLFESIIGGLVMGTFGGIVGLMIYKLGIAPSFNDGWLTTFIERYKFFNTIGKSQTVFCLAFIIGSLLGVITVILSKFINRKEISENNKKGDNFKFGLNYGVKATFRNSIKYSRYPFLLVATLYWIILYAVYSYELELYLKGLYIGFGIGLFTFLLLGGFEVISHWSIRIVLYFYGILPLNLKQLLAETADLNLINKVGGSIRFQHKSLFDYYRVKDSSQLFHLRNLKKLYGIAALLFIFFTAVAVYPIYVRFDQCDPGRFWKNGNFGLVIKNAKYNRIIDDSTIVIKTSGSYIIEVEGRVKLGTFLGRVDSYGTEMGFLGMPIGDGYDVTPDSRHGSLIYRKRHNNGNPCDWHQAINHDKFSCSSHKQDTIKGLIAGDTIIFAQNDKEYQNNIGRFEISIKFLPSKEKKDNNSNEKKE